MGSCCGKISDKSNEKRETRKKEPEESTINMIDNPC